MDVLDQILGPDISTGMRFAIAFAVVFILVVLLAWVLKRLGRGMSSSDKRGRAPRLAILEAIAVDQRRRLVLVRRDNMEHLLLLGGPSDVVVEQGIQRLPRPAAQRPVDGADMAQRQAPPVAAAPSVAPPTRPESRLAPEEQQANMAPQQHAGAQQAMRKPRPSPAAGPAPVPRLSPDPVFNEDGSPQGDDGTQKQLAEMAERLEMALRAPGQPRPAQPASAAPPVAAPQVVPPVVDTAGAPQAVSLQDEAPALELRPSANDRISRDAPPKASANTQPDAMPLRAANADLPQQPSQRKSGSLFGRLSKRSAE